MRRAAILVFTLFILFASLVAAFAEARPVSAPLSPVAALYNDQTVAEVGVTNVVAAINFDWRAYDTLGEATILLTAATGVKALLRRYLQRRRQTGVT
jgi:multisubunit Na+/H+ antiporter MnhB subunit